jgi:hypothetical protein
MTMFAQNVTMFALCQKMTMFALFRPDVPDVLSGGCALWRCGGVASC